jgi:hypothetical protein
MDWPVAGSNIFLAVAAVALIVAPIAGSRWHVVSWSLPMSITIAGAGLASFSLLAYSWRDIPGGLVAAVCGHLALAISVAALVGVGRLSRALMHDSLAAALAGLIASVLLVGGVFALGPWAGELSIGATSSVLLANPLVTVASAAGIDFLHLDEIYRTSPLAHRGVALPAWTAACAIYAVIGLAAFGASRLPSRSY